jgi:hypothetical protein
LANATEERLWSWTKTFSDRFSANAYAELQKVTGSLQNPSALPDRMRALVFSMYQPVINGAIGEHNVQEYQSSLPDCVRARLNDRWLEEAVLKAWLGDA